MQLKIPKIVSPSSSPPPKPPDEDWCQKVIDLLAEAINPQIHWAEERSKDYKCCFYLTRVTGEPEDKQVDDIPLLAGRVPSKEVLDSLVEKLFSGTAWKLKCSYIHKGYVLKPDNLDGSDTYQGKFLYEIEWRRRRWFGI